MKAYWKKCIISTMASTIMAVFVATQSGTAQEITSTDISYEPFTIEHQMELVQEEQLLLAMNNEKERIEKEREEKERLERERIEREKALKAQEVQQAKASEKAPSKSSKTLTVTSTAYTAYCKGCTGKTAIGINLRQNPNAKVIAVDPKVIPLGSKVYIPGYGEAIAGDTGGAIKGKKIDVFFPSKDQALQWGRKTITIQILSTP